MRRRSTIKRSSGSATRAKMDASLAFLVLFVAGSAVGYNQREVPYNIGPNDPYSVVVNPNSQYQEPSQRLFWSTQGSNQVGGTGLWASLTNKFPFLGNMFGKMEQLPTQYGVPNDISTQFNVPSTQYGTPGFNQVPQFYQQPQQQFYQQPQQVYQQPQQVYQQPQQVYQQPQQVYQQPQQVYQQAPQVYQQPQQFYRSPQQINQRLVPSVRDVGFTDDAVIVTPPFVPVSEPQPVPVPIPQPAPLPQPAPVPVDQGYQYNKPQYRLELPHK